ncbi:uncharacterized protein TNCV_3661191 [Trichonephila clavipes]|nr:uncharacterized protein TNCV_3661191 [Trichonephila clavipes]
MAAVDFLHPSKSIDLARGRTRNLVNRRPAANQPRHPADYSSLLTTQSRDVVCKLNLSNRIHTKAVNVERLANQRLHLARDQVSDWLDAGCLDVNAALGFCGRVCAQHPYFIFKPNRLAFDKHFVAAVAEWYRYRTVACIVTGSSPVPLKTRRVGQRCTLNLSRAETSSRWCGVVVRRGGASSGVVHVT